VTEAAGVAPAFERAEDALEGCAAIIEKGRRFLLAMHEFPDGDALGSALALWLALGDMGKEAVVYSPQGPPPNLRFLPGTDRMVRTLDAAARFDVSIACDAGDPSRLGPHFPDERRRGRVLNLDHHPRSHTFGGCSSGGCSGGWSGPSAGTSPPVCGSPS
jgi:phosphoesterase RecJ-like protein